MSVQILKLRQPYLPFTCLRFRNRMEFEKRQRNNFR
jgi:hypothetical protein